jgi:hypothetical protein
MKEVLLKFETEELYQQFINKVIIPQLKTQEIFDNQESNIIEYDFENNIGIISKKQLNEKSE